MIISASRRTDIPAHFAADFRHNMKLGFAEVKNPFRPSQTSRIGLRREEVDGFVFWTRDPRPFLSQVRELEEKGFPFYFLITHTAYPRQLEPLGVAPEEAVDAFRELSKLIGRDRIIWRYDPVVITSLTGPSFHRDNFQHLAEILAPFCFRVITSCLDLYRKTERRLARHGLLPPAGHDRYYRELTGRFAAAASSLGLQIQSCCEGSDPDGSPAIPAGKCIDESLFNTRFGLALNYQKDPHQRPGCSCHVSRDIGHYATCPSGCLYCYAS